MKKLILCIAFLFCPVLLFAGVYEDMAEDLVKKISNKKEAVAVMPFEFESNPETGRAIAQEMTTALVEENMIVVERSKIEKIIKEQSIQQTGLVDNDTMVGVGKMIGASFVVMGSVSEQGEALLINVRLVSIKKGVILATSKAQVNKDDIHSKYRKTARKGSIEYPTFFELYFGFGTMSIDASYTNPLTDSETDAEIDMNTGLVMGIRYLKESSGFFKMGIDLFYTGHEADVSSSYNYRLFTVNIPMIIRIPMWRYIEILPDYTYVFFGISAGGLVGWTDVNAGDTRLCYGFASAFLGGFKIGITENISANFEYRYMLGAINRFWHLQEFPASSDTETKLVQNQFSGSQILFGISFAP